MNCSRFATGSLFRLLFVSFAFLLLMAPGAVPAAAEPGDEVNFHGMIDRIDPEHHTFLSGGYTVIVTRSTIIRSEDGDALNFSDLLEGMKVAVRGTPPPYLQAELNRNTFVMASHVKVVSRPGGEEFFLTGPIQDIPPVITIEPMRIVVEDVTVLITNNTRVSDSDGTPIPAHTLRVGDRVRVRAVYTSHHEHPLALAIKRLSDEHEPGTQVRFKGLVESVNPDHGGLVVRGVRVHVSDDTVIIDHAENTLTLEDLERGDRVQVSGVWGRDRVVHARKIVLLGPPHEEGQEVAFTGPISRLHPDRPALVAAGRLVIVTDDTEIFDIEGQPATFGDLIVGDTVLVEGVVLPLSALDHTSAVQAALIQVKRPGCIDRQLTGVVERMSDTRWRVSGHPVLIAEETTFSDREGNALTAEDFAVGDRVHVQGCAAPRSPLAAEHITLLLDAPEPPHCRPTVAFGGAVEDVDLHASTLTVRGRTILVTEDTALWKRGEGRIALADVKPGDRAFVQATQRASDPQLIGCRIVIAGDSAPPPPPSMHRVTGRITSISTPTLTLVIRDTTIQATEETAIFSRTGEALEFADLAVGQFAEAKGILDADRTLLARVIRVQEENRPPGWPHSISGKITSINLPHEMTVNHHQIVFTERTTFTGIEGHPIQPNTLQVGDLVRVVVDPDVPVIMIYPPIYPAKHVSLRAAVIQDIDLDERLIKVSGGPVSVREFTEITDLEGNELRLEDLMVGDLVRVRLSMLAIFPPEATHILRVRSVNFSGPVDDFAPAEHFADNGRPTLRSTGNVNTLGYISLPFAMESASGDTLYDVRMRVSTDVEERHRVPTMRLRLNMANWEKGTTYEVDSRGDAQFVPTPEGREYRTLFVPTEDYEGATDFERQFFASLDLLSFDARHDPNATLRMDSIDVRAIDLSRVQAVHTLFVDDLPAGAGNWEYGSAPEAFDPAPFGAQPGFITLGPGESDSFGFWTLRTGVPAEPGRIYRARFVVRSSTNHVTELPNFRLRLNTSNFELTSTSMIGPYGPAREIAGTAAKLYDVYLVVPEDASGEETILASFDLIAFGEGIAKDTAITVEEFILEEVEVVQ